MSPISLVGRIESSAVLCVCKGHGGSIGCIRRSTNNHQGEHIDWQEERMKNRAEQDNIGVAGGILQVAQHNKVGCSYGRAWRMCCEG